MINNYKIKVNFRPFFVADLIPEKIRKKTFASTTI